MIDIPKTVFECFFDIPTINSISKKIRIAVIISNASSLSLTISDRLLFIPRDISSSIYLHIPDVLSLLSVRINSSHQIFSNKNRPLFPLLFFTLFVLSDDGLLLFLFSSQKSHPVPKRTSYTLMENMYDIFSFSILSIKILWSVDSINRYMKIFTSLFYFLDLYFFLSKGIIANLSYILRLQNITL